jgi:MFS superfamily sulfate permease-like transporter
VIILKQIPHALGRDKDFEGDFAFLEGQENTLTDLLEAVLSANPAAVAISVCSLALLILWEREEVKRIRALAGIPGPLMVVILGILMNSVFQAVAPSFALTGPEHLVSLPVPADLRSFFGQFTFPDWSAFQRKEAFLAGATIAVVASIESLLSLEAADKLDPYKRISPASRELVAQGIGNTISGLLGGLPVTSVVVRTSANVYAGARTKRSTIFHGMLLLVSALSVPWLLNRTPLACLAAILLLIGYKLARVRLFESMWRAGLDQFVPFLVTVLAIVFTDLLNGVLIGMALGLVFVLRANQHRAIVMVSQDNHYLMRLNKDMTFMNKSAFKETLRSVPDGSSLVIDGTKALYVDRDIIEVMDEFRQSAYFRKIDVQVKNFAPNARPLAAGGGGH